MTNWRATGPYHRLLLLAASEASCASWTFEEDMGMAQVSSACVFVLIFLLDLATAESLPKACPFTTCHKLYHFFRSEN